MKKNRYRLYFFVITIVLTVKISFGQVIREEVIFAYIYNFAMLSTSAKQDTLNTYNIVLISEDKRIIRVFRKYESIQKIHNKNIKITVSRNGEIDYGNICLAYISYDKRGLYHDVFNNTIDKEVLLVTENYDDKGKILINLRDTDEGKILFEINKGNIFFRQIYVKDEILLLGGTEIDVVELYRKKQNELESLENGLYDIQKLLSETEKKVNLQKAEIKEQQDFIDSQKIEQQKLLIEINSHKEQILKQHQDYNRSKHELKQSSDSLNRTKNLLKEQKEKIVNGNIILEQQKHDIKQKEQIIQLKEDVLGEQYQKIRKQRIIVASFIAAFIIITVLIALLLQSFRDKNKKNKLLEEQKEEIGKMNAELSAQKEYLEITNDNLNEINVLLNERQQFIEKQSKLLEAKNDELNKLNATKDKFFSIIAHDLKNPLVAVMGLSDLMLSRSDDLDPKRMKEFIESINTASENLFKLLENLLQWARSQTGSIRFSPVSLNINRIVENNFSLLKELAARKNIRFVKNIDNGLVVNADPNMMNAIVRNLLTNAIKYTEKGSVTVSTKIQGNELILNITDTGIGIRKEKIKNLFSIERNKSTPGTKGEPGTGLGLITCRDFIEKHNGAIKVDSTIGKGTTFSVIIPINAGSSE